MSRLEGPLVAFSGSRAFTDRLLIERLMRRLVRKWPAMLVRVGDAAGADELIAHESTRWGKWPDVKECHWPPAGATKQERWLAAHERNERVLQDADHLVALFAPGPRSPGTSDAIGIARRRGIPVDVYHDGHWTKE